MSHFSYHLPRSCTRDENLRAAKLTGAAQAIREEMGADTRLPHEITEFEEAMSLLGESLGEAERDAAIQQGRAWSVDDAIEYARSSM